MSTLCPACETPLDLTTASYVPQHGITLHLGAPPCPASGKTLADARDQAQVVRMFDAMRRLNSLIEPYLPLPAKVEMHPFAIHALLRVVPTFERPTWPWEPAPIGALMGIPLVPKVDMPVGAWRILDRDGGVLREGVVGVSVDGEPATGADSPSTANHRDGSPE